MFPLEEAPPMSETTIDTTTETAAEAADEASGVSALDVQLLRRLADQARGEGMELTGEGGLLQQLT